MKISKKELKDSLLPLYDELLKGNSFEDVCTFCLQWGENFPVDKKTGILFVGKAVNGWIHDETDINVLFGETSDRIFARSDQMEWVSRLEGDEKYNTNKSAFWRVIKRVSQHYYPNEKWYSNVAWSNLCKIAPFKGGNPNDKLYYEQLKSCQKILSKEMTQIGDSWRDFAVEASRIYKNRSAKEDAYNAIADELLSIANREEIFFKKLKKAIS